MVIQQTEGDRQRTAVCLFYGLLNAPDLGGCLKKLGHEA